MHESHAFPFFMKVVHGEGKGLHKSANKRFGGILLETTFQTNMGAPRNMDNFEGEEGGYHPRDNAKIDHLRRPFTRGRDIWDTHVRIVFIKPTTGL